MKIVAHVAVAKELELASSSINGQISPFRPTGSNLQPDMAQCPSHSLLTILLEKRVKGADLICLIVVNLHII